MKNFSKYLPLAAIGAGLIMAKRNNGVSGIGQRYTIQEIFELRKDGQFAKAYNAAKQMYSEYSGHYTTLCMFWTSVDYARLLAETGQLKKARIVLQDAIDIYPKLQDVDRSAKKAVVRVKDMLYSDDYHQAELPFISGIGYSYNSPEDMYYAYRAVYKLLSDKQLVEWMVNEIPQKDIETVVYQYLYEDGTAKNMVYVNNSEQAMLAGGFMEGAISRMASAKSTLDDERRHAERMMVAFF